MQNISTRHHYLPQFFIKGFIKPAVDFWVYDKETDKISSAPKSPKSFFFEPGRNSFKMDDVEFDILEKVYFKYIDDWLAEPIKKVQTGIIEEVETGEFYNNVSLLAALSFYRVPANDDYAEEVIRKRIERINDLPVNDRTAEFIHLINLLQSIPIGEEAKQKFITSFWPFLDFFSTNKDLWKGKGHYKIYDNPIPCYVLSDNPVLYEKPPSDFYDLTDSFIFPLTTNRVFYGLNGDKCSINPEIIGRINILLMMQSKRYFASPDKVFLERAVNCYRITKPIQDHFWYITNGLFEMINK